MSKSAAASFFRPAAGSRGRAGQPGDAAHAIVEAEAAERARKSARLRKLRLETADPDPAGAPAAGRPGKRVPEGKRR